MSQVSLIGLGAMGSALGSTLLANDYTVTVWNRTSGKADEMGAAGAAVALSIEDAVAASPIIMFCIKSHVQTLSLVTESSHLLDGKTVIELSTGTSVEAALLAQELERCKARWLIGVIHGYPSGIGQPDKVLTMAGAVDVWNGCEVLLKTLGGKSCHVGTEPTMLAALFAGLFTVRTSFMFGMIYGAVVTKKAGIPVPTFLEQIPVSMDVLPSYYQSFAETVSQGNYEDPPASMETYAAAFDDALKTFESLGAAAELPRLMHDMARLGVDSGQGEKAITKLVDLLAPSDQP